VTALDQDQIKSSIEAEVKSFLSEQLRNVQIPPQSGQTDTSMGTYKYDISEMVLSDMKFENVKVDIQQRKITISVKDLEAHMKNVSWKYAQIKFPYLKDSGTLDASVSQVSCNIDFEIKPMGGGPAYKRREIVRIICTHRVTCGAILEKALVVLCQDLLLILFHLNQ